MPESDIDSAISSWIASKQTPNLGLICAYNIFLAPGVTVTLGSDKSCVTFCYYHDSINWNEGPFFTFEPFSRVSSDAINAVVAPLTLSPRDCLKRWWN
ncbi:MAG: hypothetical protein LVQ63_03430 [Thermoplasmatales archaeon]|nr:hypothetical protein [Thermoplasmatales archaeon]